jgi:SAM-dependent methyltransferase
MTATHDNLPFEQLSQEYNFLKISNYARVLTNLILGEMAKCQSPPRILDIGCGNGIGRSVHLQHEIRAQAGEFWGLEPDESVKAPEGLFFNYQHALMETAELPENYFDIVYSSMVMEHVEHPELFLAAVARCLTPGGVYLFLTPNEASLVPKITKWCRILKLDELALRAVRRSETIEEYHYPVQFRFNSPRVIDRIAKRMGFLSPDYAFIEGTGAASYFPGPLRPIYSMVKLKRNLIKNPRRLSTLICRMRKAT